MAERSLLASPRGPRVQTQTLAILYTENCLEQTKILKKRLGMVHFNTKRKCRKVSSGDSFLKMVADDDDDETFTCFPYFSNHSILFTF